IACAEAGLETVVLERHPAPIDKACGEGLMPRAVRALARLGVLDRIDPARSARFVGIRFVQEDGTTIEAPFPADPGLCVRRTALVEALRRRAAEAGARLLFGAQVKGMEFARSHARLQLAERRLDTQVIVAADGLHSRLRKMAGLAGPPARRRRFGLRRHFDCAPWSVHVE